MATERTASIKQSLAEQPRQWDFDFNPDLPTGVTVASAVATHIPPSGSAGTATVGTIASGIVPVKLSLPSPLVTGDHILSCVATFSNGDDSEIRLHIQVDF